MKKIFYIMCSLLFFLILTPTCVFAEVQVWSGQVASGFSGGDGTEQNPYQISSGEELALMAKNINNGLKEFSEVHYVLINDICLNNISNYEKWESNPPANLWTPIGYLEEETQEKIQSSISFDGSFDGNGFAIEGMYLKTKNQNSCAYGLFAYCENGIIKNVNLTDSFITGISARGEVFTGSIAGYIGEKGTIDNCNSKVKIQYITSEDNVEYSSYIGGIVGKCEGYIKNCQSNSTINLVLDFNKNKTVVAGGIAGYSRKITSSVNEGSITGINYNSCNLILGGIAATGMNIEDSRNKGIISNKFSSSSIGGILGEGEATIKNCNNFGDILSGTNSSCTGGIFGKGIKKSKIENCVNYANILCENDNAYIGGITGLSEGVVSIVDCKNKGNITLGSDTIHAGGILGEDKDFSNEFKSYILNCSNSGKISIGDNNKVIGGISGGSHIKVDKSINTGMIIGGENIIFVGGIAGTNGGGIITNSTNTGNITLGKNSKWIGGITGENGLYIRSVPNNIGRAAQLSNCMNRGNINASGDSHVGGITGDSYVNIYNCISVGKVIGDNKVGAISGRATVNNPKYINCFAVSGYVKIENGTPFKRGKELKSSELNSSKTIGLLNKWSKGNGKSYLNWEKGKNYPQLVYK